MHTQATPDSALSSQEHADPLKTYIAVFASLMVLLFLTVGAYFLDFERFHVGEHTLGWVNTLIALLIAGVKTSLVVLFFMHLRHSTRLTWIVAAAGFVFLCIMVLFTFSDYLSRNAVSESVREAQVDPQTATHANGEALLQEIPNQVNTPGW
jgi:cytochrome c oxidase subunit 4